MGLLSRSNVSSCSFLPLCVGKPLFMDGSTVPRASGEWLLGAHIIYRHLKDVYSYPGQLESDFKRWVTSACTGWSAVSNLCRTWKKIRIYLKAHRSLRVKWWDKGYDELLYMTDFYLSLQTEGWILNCVPCTKLSTTWTCFRPDIVVPKVTRSYTSTPFTLYQHIPIVFSSFVPHAVSHWNSLPESVVSSPSFATFKHSLTMYYMH